MQLQRTAEPEERHNPVSWGSERLGKLFESVYSAEAKSAEMGIKAYLKMLPLVKKLFGDLKTILFTDNKALFHSLSNNSEDIHPFASTSIDFIKQSLTDFNITAKWVKTSDNLSDILTKPSRL